MNPECKPPACYKSFKSDKEPSPPCERPGCGGRMKLERYRNTPFYITPTLFIVVDIFRSWTVLDMIS